MRLTREVLEVLATYQNLDAVHLVSHGHSDALQLGNSALSADNLTDYQSTISAWQSSLSEQADLLLYGCDLAASANGQTLVSGLQQLTGADVAASDDLTGQAVLGGDWELEYQAGEIETAVVFSTQIQSNWSGVLGTPSITNLAGDTLIYGEGDGAQVIEQSGDISTSDGGHPEDHKSLAISITGNKDGSQDELGIDQSGLITLSASNVVYNSSTVIGTYTGGGAGGGDLTITFNGNADNTNVAALIESITYTNTDSDSPNTDQRTINFTLTNSFNNSASYDTYVNVSALNDAPTAANQTVTTNEDTTYTFSAADFNFIDVDGDNLSSVKITALESAGSLQLGGVDVTLNQVISRADIDAGKLSFIPTAEDNGTGYDNFSFTVNDGMSNSTVSYTMTIDVNAQNDAPTISGTANTSITAGESYSFIPTANDSDGDTLTYSISNKPAWASFDSSTGALTGTPTDTDSGTTSNIIITVSDGTVSTPLASFDLTVTTATVSAATEQAQANVEPAALGGIEFNTGAGEVVAVSHNTPVVEQISTESSENVATETPAKEDAQETSELVLTVDESQNPTLLVQQGAAPRIQQLTANANVPIQEVASFADQDGDETDNQLIQRHSPWLNGETSKFDLKMALEELNANLADKAKAEQTEQGIVVTTTTGISVTLTAGFIGWALKGSSLAAALMNALPVWNSFDPLPILNGVNGNVGNGLRNSKPAT